MWAEVGKLRGRGARELRVRGTQALSAWLERRGLGSAARLPDERALAGLLATPLAAGESIGDSLLRTHRASASRFMPALADRDGTLAALRRLQPDDERVIIARADRAIAGRFDLLGHDALSFGMPIDWQADPLAGTRAPLAHWSRVPYLDPAIVGDHKVVWELNRHGHFVTLGQAWWYTGDGRYADAFASQLAAWMDANPPKLGINWASSLEVAFRAISWTWALRLFADAPALTAALHARAVAFLVVHARHLERYLSTYFSPNTHLTGEALGLYYLGTALAALAPAAEWRETGRRILLAELGRQLRADGAYFEQATYYHRYTVEFYLHLALLGAANGEPLPDESLARVLLALEYLRDVARPDGTLPLLGDDDGGQLIALTGPEGGRDTRATLAVGAALFAQGELRGTLGDPPPAAALWMLGARGAGQLAALRTPSPAACSRPFAESGSCVMRDGWGASASWLHIDCGPHGALTCGHAHADALAFELCVAGRPALVDAGTYTYVGAERDLFRGTAAHNTLTLDGIDSSEPADGPFAWHTTAVSEVRAWVTGDRFDYFAGAHDGYRRLPAAAEHERAVLAVRGEGWLVRDRVASSGRHDMAIRFHAAPGLGARQTSPCAAVLAGADSAPLLALGVNGGDLGTLAVEQGWVSPAFGRRDAAPVLCWRETTTVGSHDVLTLLLPGDAGATVAPVAAVGGRALVRRRASGASDLLLAAAAGAGIAVDGVATTAALAWVHRDASGAIAWIVAAGGGTCVVDGEPLMQGTSATEWMVADRAPADASWRVLHGALAVPARAGQRATRAEDLDPEPR